MFIDRKEMWVIPLIAEVIFFSSHFADDLPDILTDSY